MKPDDTKPEIDLLELLKLNDFDEETQEIGLREFRIRGIDKVIDALKKTLDKEETNALNRYLRMCPRIEGLTDYLISHYPESKPLFEAYVLKLHRKIISE